MITCLIIEDEKPSRERLKSFVSGNNSLDLIDEAENAIDAIKKINEQKPQLIFLDVQLPDLSGLDILKVIKHKPFVIFTTAYDQYALNAFQNNAIDFLLKPFSQESFNKAIDKVKEKIQFVPDVVSEMGKFLEQVRIQANLLTRIPAKVGEKIFILGVQDILYFKSKDKVVFAHLKNDYYIINYTLDELQQRLNNEQFFRIHRSTIVNLDFVRTIEPFGGGTFLMRLKDSQKSELQISRNAAREIREKLGW
jgi:two-component system LytT family response regulator